LVKATTELRVQRKVKDQGPARGYPSLSQRPGLGVRVRRWEKPSWPNYGWSQGGFHQRQNPTKPNPGIKGVCPPRSSDGIATGPYPIVKEDGRDLDEAIYSRPPADEKAAKGPGKMEFAPRGQWAKKYGHCKLTMFSKSSFPVYVGPQRPSKDEGGTE
jgi:hypothetical protein